MGGAELHKQTVIRETGVKGQTPFTLLPTVDWVHSFLFDGMHLVKNLGNDLLNMMLGGPIFVKGLARSLAHFEMWPAVAANVTMQPWSWSADSLKDINGWMQDILQFPEAWSTDYKKVGIPSKAKNAKGMKSHTHKVLFQCGLYAELANWPRGTCNVYSKGTVRVQAGNV
jgi:hypothetical protein